MATRFAPHGEFKAYVDGRIIVSEVRGPWNNELVEKWASELHLLAVQLAASGPHVGLALIHESLMCPPDAFETMRLAVAYGTTRLHCIGNCIVADAGVEGRALLLPTYEKIYDKSTVYRFFFDLASARAWALALLAEQGY